MLQAVGLHPDFFVSAVHVHVSGSPRARVRARQGPPSLLPNSLIDPTAMPRRLDRPLRTASRSGALNPFTPEPHQMQRHGAQPF